MLNKQDFIIIGKYFGEEVLKSKLIKKSDCSNIFLIKTNNQCYIVKQGLFGEDMKKEFENHKTVFNIWKNCSSQLQFFIPRVYFFDDMSNYYVVEFVESSDNLQDLIINGDFRRLEIIFAKLGKVLFNYHKIMTSSLKNDQISLFKHDTVNLIVKNNKNNKKLYDLLPLNSRRIIFKDFKATNLLVDDNQKIYFIDFQNIYYFAPFYHDLSRFIDTIRIFTFLKSPLWYFHKRKKINKLLDLFLKKYDDKLSTEFLNIARRLHQTEHVCMKKNRGQQLNALILLILYKIKL